MIKNNIYYLNIIIEIILITIFLLFINSVYDPDHKDSYNEYYILTIIAYTACYFKNKNIYDILNEKKLFIYITFSILLPIVLIYFKSKEILYSRLVLIILVIFLPICLYIYRKYILSNVLLKFSRFKNDIVILNLTKENIANELRADFRFFNIKKVFQINEYNECISYTRNNTCSALYIFYDDENNNIFKVNEDLYNTSALLCYYYFGSKVQFINPSIRRIKGNYVLTFEDKPFSKLDYLLKRIFDILFSFSILILLSPLLIITAFIIKIESSGPVFFFQRRYGLYGKQFKVFKFRTMNVCEDNEIKQAAVSDSRITRFGKILRKTSIDEMPQFINVLIGQMSVVGPRPHANQHNEQFRKLLPSYMRRHIIKPGITGWAQVNGWRGLTDNNEKIIKRTEHDIFYIENWSFILDIKIIILTVFKIVHDEKAH